MGKDSILVHSHTSVALFTKISYKSESSEINWFLIKVSIFLNCTPGIFALKLKFYFIQIHVFVFLNNYIWLLFWGKKEGTVTQFVGFSRLKTKLKSENRPSKRIFTIGGKGEEWESFGLILNAIKTRQILKRKRKKNYTCIFEITIMCFYEKTIKA